MVQIAHNEVPDGFILGLGRDEPRPQVAHLYEGPFCDPGRAMCKRGYNRGDDGWSIWRGNFGSKGVCAVCLRRAREGRDPIPWPGEIV